VNDNIRIAAAARLTGLTIAQLRYFERMGLVQPHYVMSHRRYTPGDLEHLRLIKGLLDVGFRPNQLQAVLLSQDATEEKNLTGKQVLARLLLEAAQRNTPFQLDVPTTKSYNTTYKALGRLARQMGLRLHRQKEGAALTVIARPF